MDAVSHVLSLNEQCAAFGWSFPHVKKGIVEITAGLTPLPLSPDILMTLQ